MAVRILCAGDLHLGRKPTRVPDDLCADLPGPRQAWEALVRTAIDGKVDVVALTGDVVDEDNKFFEAYGPLQSGVAKMAQAGISIFAVSGNHDFDVLPRLAGEIPEFHLLGRGGLWEEYCLEKDGIPLLRFQGWSFPKRRVTSNPLVDRPAISPDVPAVGLLHCDCDGSSSPYAPVSLAELKTNAPAVWLLGHIHKPQCLFESFPLILYPGSPQGLDPSETGPHGAWLITIEPGGEARAECLPLASLRWEGIDLPLDLVSDMDSLQSALIDALRQKHDQIRDDLGDARCVGCRITLQGRTAIHRELASMIAQIQSAASVPLEGITYFIDKIEDHSRPQAPLEGIAHSNDPVGLLAQRLLLLEHREPAADYQALVKGARQAVEKNISASQFLRLDDNDKILQEEQLRELLMRAGLLVLDKLLAQKETDA